MTIARRSVWALALSLLAIGLVGPTPAAAICSNESLRESQASEALPLGTVGFPHCMALEMVSPPSKQVQPAFLPSFSPDGERVRFRSIAALGDTTGLQSVFGDRYVGIRGSDGWETVATSPPAEAGIATGSDVHGGPYAFSVDFERWISVGARHTQATAGQMQFFTGGLDGSFEPLSPLLVPIDDSGTPDIVFDAANSSSTGASADLSVTVFRPKAASTAYLPGDPRGTSVEEPGQDQSNYLAQLDQNGDPSIQLLARDKDGAVYGGRCGTHLGGGTGGPRGTGRLNQGAISADGDRIYFSTRPSQPPSIGMAGPPCSLANPLRIMKRTETPAGPTIEGLIPGGPVAGNDLYQGASLDGTRVYLTTTRALAGTDKDSGGKCGKDPGASAGCDLYLYDSNLPEGNRLIQVSAGEAGSTTPGEGANVLSSIVAISADGSHAYFVAEGALTTEASPEGELPQEGQPNLYLYERSAAHPSGRTLFIGTVDPGDAGEDPESNLWGTERSHIGDAAAVPFEGDGHVLVFASEAPLTADDADGEVDLFHYDSDKDTLERITKAAPGGSETPAAEAVLNAISFTESRWVSEDGQAVAFATAEPLVPGDEDEASNPYLWKEGELLRLPAIVGDPEEAPVVSAAGDSVAFATPEVLLPFDGDTAKDVYVARVNGGFPNPAPPQFCDPLQEGACQESAPSVPAIPSAATRSFSGPGNPKGASCRKPKVKRKGRCVKPRRRAAKGRNAKRAKNERGGRR